MKRTKKILSLLLSSCILVGSIPHISHASEPCEHHTEHTNACGFIESHEGTACNHNHTDDCYIEVESTKEVNICSHTCTDEELSISGNNGVCSHICDDNCISVETEIIKELNCQHTEHTDDCGYSEAIEGVECSYECNICKLQSLIDSLQDGVSSDEEKSNAEASLTEIDTLKSSLSDEELSQVDFTKYTDLISALNTYYTGSNKREEVQVTAIFDIDRSEVYVKNTVDYTSNGTGTKDSPFSSFVNALNNVSNGGTIYIIGNADINSNEGIDGANGETLPFVIDKSITIEGADDSMATLSTRTAGFILGADVTFKNIKFGLANPARNAIFANGHRLELINCGKDGTDSSGGRKVNVFAGGVPSSSATTGDSSEIIINGTCSSYDSIYGGSMDTSFDKPVSISLSNLERGKVTGLYASGAQIGIYDPDNWFDFSAPSTPIADSTVYPSTGNVNITLNSVVIDTVYGDASSGNKANLYINTGHTNPYFGFNPVDIGTLTIEGGLVGLISIPDSININSGATLLADEDASGNYIDEVNNLHGESGSKLRLNKDNFLVINGTFTGEIELQTEEGQYGNNSTSGTVNNNHTYIFGNASNTGRFTFIPHTDNQDIELVNKDGNWTTQTIGSSGGEVEESKISSFNIVDSTLTEEVDTFTNHESEIELEISDDSFYFISDCDLSYIVRHNGNTYTGTSVYNDDTYTQVCDIVDLNLRFETYDTDTSYINITKVDNNLGLQAGTYEITVKIPSEYTVDTNGLSDILTLIVNGGSTDHTVHTPSDTWSKDDNSHWKTCTVEGCTERLDEEEHNHEYRNFGTSQYVNGHALECTVCGHMPTTTLTSHSSVDGKYYLYDENNEKHYQLCECGAEINIASHNYTYTSDGDAGHISECIQCGYDKDGGAVEAHTPKDDTLRFDSIDDSQHYYVCICGEEIGFSTHTLSHQSDDKYHWQGCECGYIDGSKEAHTPKDDTLVPVVENPGDTSTTHHGKQCECGRYIELEEHYAINDELHNSNQGILGGDYHAKYCICGVDVELEEHSYTEFKSVDETGHEQYCICGDEKPFSFQVHDSAEDLEWVIKDGDTRNHYKICKCGYEVVAEAHTLSYQSSETQHWLECECGYVDGVKEEHSLSDWNMDGDKHWKECTICTKQVGLEKHTTKIQSNMDVHWEQCTICDESINIEPHVAESNAIYQSILDTTKHAKHCSCGKEVDYENHTYIEYEQFNSVKEHFKVCDCGSRIVESHISDSNIPFSTDGEYHWKECECGYLVFSKVNHTYAYVHNEEVHWEVCLACSKEKEADVKDSHTPVDNTYYKDDSTFEHYQLCICGEELNRERHEALDTYTYDEKSHYKHCICGQEMAREDHKPGAEATETSDQVCLVCNFVIKEMLNHEHDWGTWVSNRDNTHTRVCKTNSNHTETLTCSGGLATCKDKAICTTCNEEYGNLNSSKHVGKTEVRDKTSTYTGDTYCLDCNTKIASGSKITSDDGNSGSSSSTGSSSGSSSTSSSSSSNQNSNNSSSGSSSSSNTTSENTNTSTNTSNNTITNTGNNTITNTGNTTPEKPISTLTTNKPVIVIEEYTIKRGDTLSKIARRYGCTLEELINANKDVIKNPNLIHIGWKLNIPTKKVESESNSINGVNNTTLAVDINNSESYVIQQGDSLWKISRKYGCTIEELLAYNADTIKNPNLIIAGKKLRIPKR